MPMGVAVYHPPCGGAARNRSTPMAGRGFEVRYAGRSPVGLSIVGELGIARGSIAYSLQPAHLTRPVMPDALQEITQFTQTFLFAMRWQCT